MPPKKQTPVIPKEDSIPEVKKKPVLKKGKPEPEPQPEPKIEVKPEVAIKIVKKKGKEPIPEEKEELIPEVVKEDKVVKKKGKPEVLKKPESVSKSEPKEKEKPVPEVVKLIFVFEFRALMVLLVISNPLVRKSLAVNVAVVIAEEEILLA
jgi:hypothetical protein